VHLLALALWALHAVPAWAAPMRVVIRVDDAIDEALLARIRGQTSDLAVELIPVAGAAGAALPDQMDGARQLADREQAGAVVWFTHVGCAQKPGAVAGILVQLSQPARRTVLVYDSGSVGCEEAGLGLPSHAREEVAIAVRSALAALAEGGNLGVAAAGVSPGAVVQAATSVAPVPPPNQLLVNAGWLVIADGAAKTGQQGIEAGAALARGRLMAGLRLASTFPAQTADDLSTVSLSRGDASLMVGGRIPLGDRLTVSAAVYLGLALLARTTSARGADVMAAAPSRTLSPLLSPELRLHVPLHRGAGLGLALAVGVDYLPAVPRLVYLRDGELQPRSGPAVLQPRLALAIELLR
jgi:hypothetical protein